MKESRNQNKTKNQENTNQEQNQNRQPEQPEQKQPLTVLRDTGLRMLSGSCIFY